MISFLKAGGDLDGMNRTDSEFHCYANDCFAVRFKAKDFKASVFLTVNRLPDVEYILKSGDFDQAIHA